MQVYPLVRIWAGASSRRLPHRVFTLFQYSSQYQLGLKDAR